MNWNTLLTDISHEVLTNPHGWLADLVTPAQQAAGWLGRPGATALELEVLEQRLQQPLPASYRQFLQASNGFGPINSFIYHLYPSQEVDWLVNYDPDLVELWESGQTERPSVPDVLYFRYDDTQNDGDIRVEYMRGLLMVSDWGDAGFLALNPAVLHDGEWEAWHFANWMPGAQRYRSFGELMETALYDYRALKEEPEA